MKIQRALRRVAALWMFGVLVALPVVNARPANAAKLWDAGNLVTYP